MIWKQMSRRFNLMKLMRMGELDNNINFLYNSQIAIKPKIITQKITQILKQKMIKTH